MNDEANSRRISRREFVRTGLGGAALLSVAPRASLFAPQSVSDLARNLAVRGGTLRVGLLSAGSSETLDIRKPFNFPDFIRLFNLLDPLFFQGPHGIMSPGLATEAHSNKNFTVWTLRLRDGVHWHDGKPFTADDVVYTLKASWNSPQGLNYNLYKPLIDFKGVRKVDKLTVRIPLLRSVAQFPQLTFTQASHIIQNGTKDFSRPVGTGPFKLQSFTPGTQSVFLANRNYWRSSEPYVDKLVIDSSYTSDPARLNALLAGDLDIVPSVPPALAKAQQSAKRVALGNKHGSGFIAVTMRVDQPPFTDKRVRKAMKLIPDRPTIVSSALDGFAVPGNDCPGNTLEFWASDLTAKHDPEQAKALLKAAGKDSLSLTLYTAAVLAGMNETATLFAEQASAAGVKVSVKTNDPATYYSTGSPGGTWPNKQFSVNNWIIGQGSLPLFYLSALFGNAPYNETHWHSRPGDKLVSAALAEGRAGAAKEKWHAVQKLQYDAGGYIVTSALNWVDAYSLKVHGIHTTEAGPCNYWDFKSAWLSS